MAKLMTFIPKKSKLQPPPRFSPEQLTEWKRMVHVLGMVGMSNRVKRATLVRYVKRAVRSHALYIDTRKVRGLADRLSSMAKKAEGRDKKTLLAASARMTDLWFAQIEQERRLSMAMLQFLRAHRLTPQSRRED